MAEPSSPLRFGALRGASAWVTRSAGRGSSQRAAGLLLTLFCAGCAPHPAAPLRDAPNAHLKLALDMTPRPVTALDPTQFTVQIRDAANHPVSGAAVVLDLAMPSMPMGVNEVALRETQAGRYTGTGRFTMGGDWRVTVTASLGTERAAQAFTLKVQ